MSAALRLARRHPDAVCLTIVLLAAMSFKLGFALRIAPFIAKDSQAYFLPAYDLVNSGQFELGLRRVPAYPLFLAGALVLLGDDLRGIVLAQHLLGIGTAGLAYVLGRLVAGEHATAGRAIGLVAGLLSAISAPLVTYEHYLLTEALFAFSVTGMLVGLVWAYRRNGLGGWLLAGILVGLAVMVKPIAQAFLPLALVAAYLAGASWTRVASQLRWPAPTRVALVAVTMVAAGYALAIVPWSIRNQLVHDLASPSTFGRTLIARTASYDRGFVFVDPSRPEHDPTRARAAQIVQRGADRGDSDGTIAQRLRQELDLDPVEVNAVMRDLALQAIVRQPIYFAEGSLRFALRIFNGLEIRLRDHEAERKDVEWNERTRSLLAFVRSEDDARFANGLLKLWQPALWAPLPLVLFALGVMASLIPGWRLGLLVGACVTALVVASAALNGPQERYRYPVDPAIAVLMASGVAAVVVLAIQMLRRVPVAASVTTSPLSPLSDAERGSDAGAMNRAPTATDPVGARFIAPTGS
ncbi:MAG TPA: glycosyltransferase family 39 protein [Chloroflexota bacterium]|nr:glycosyltransferase family 39 protein [Chloroflexota bacterium]